jgi:hypothetical protein
MYYPLLAEAEDEMKRMMRRGKVCRYIHTYII